MKNTYRRGVTLLLALSMLATMAACGRSEEDPYATPVPEFVYKASYTSLPEELSDMSNVCWRDGLLYFRGSTFDGMESHTDPESGEKYEYETYKESLFTMKEDGTGLTELAGYETIKAPAGLEGEGYIQSMSVDADGYIWIIENLYAHAPYDYGDMGGPVPFSEEFGTVITDSGGTVVRMLSSEMNDVEPLTADLLAAVALPAPTAEPATGSDIYIDESVDLYYLRKLGPTGEELSRTDLSELTAQPDNEYSYFYVNGMAMDAEGNIYLATGEQGVIVLSSEGEHLFTIKLDGEGWINSILRLNDGRVAAVGYNYTATTSSEFFQIINPATKSWGESFEAPPNAWNFFTGGGEYDFCYNTNTSLYGSNLVGGKSETVQILNWINCDVDSDALNAIIPLPDGRILCTTYSWDRMTGENGRSEMVTLTKVPYVPEDQKTVLTYACLYVDYYLRGEIIKFNKTSENYRIEVLDYSEYNTEDDYTAGLTKLSTEIIAGRVPDILQSDGSLPIRQYAAKGLLEDLWPFIEADPTLGRDSLIEPVFKALEQEGKLYQTAASFTINSAVALRSIVGDVPGWTVDEMYAALAKLPAGADIMGYGYTRDEMLRTVCALSLDELVDWKTGECHFDSAEFKKLLEFVNGFAASFDWENHEWSEDDGDVIRMRNGKQLMTSAYLYSYDYYPMQKAQFDGDMTFIGFPTENRNGNTFNINMGLSMSAKSQHKDGVWEFISRLLSEEYQSQEYVRWNGFSTNIAAYNNQLKEAMTENTYEDPVTHEIIVQPKSTWGNRDGTETQIFALTQQEADEIMALIQSTNRVYSYDQVLFEIISDESAPFFTGQKSVDETASLVQNRVSLYVNEQR